MDNQVLSHSECNANHHVANRLQHVPLSFHVQGLRQRTALVWDAAWVYAVTLQSVNFLERVTYHVHVCCELLKNHAEAVLTQ